MKFPSKFFRVHFKLYLRSIKKSPHIAAVSFMTFITLSLFSSLLTDSYFKYDQFKESTFTKWNSIQNSFSGRTLASSDITQCNENTIDLLVLKNEIKILESQYEAGHFIEGSLFSINLRSLPSVQAQFLADYGHLIGTQNQSQNFSSCDSVPCILTKIYQGNQEAGNLAYYWYLKTGSMLSVGNKIPGQESKIPGKYNGKKHPLEAYLFSPDELKKFYILAKSLPERFLHNPLLTSIHKIPTEENFEGFTNGQCSLSTPNGQIFITEKCLGTNTKQFLLTMANQMAKFIDQYDSNKSGHASISSSKNWLENSLWLQESYFNPKQETYKSRWFSTLPKSEFVSSEAMSSPAQQFSELLSYYRFAPAEFIQRTPLDLQNTIKDNFFNGKSFDGNGLLNQYIEMAANEWSKNESEIWQDCFEQFLQPDFLAKSTRDLASQIDNPLYSCVEFKIPSFIQGIETKIKAQNFEGCQFFQDQNKYGHLSEKFNIVLDKFLNEKILKRKIEFQNHGIEVLLGNKIKADFIATIDPSSIYINCFNSKDTLSCYTQNLDGELDKILNKHQNSLSKYYTGIIKQDLLALYPFDAVSEKTNNITKKFIAPFYNKIHFAATEVYSNCKEEKFSFNANLNSSLRFSGGKNFINANLINCINSKIDKKLNEITNLTVFQERDEKRVEFKLTKPEKEFALSFMEGKFIQTLNNILQDDVKLEKVRLGQYFTESKEKITNAFMQNDNFYKETFSIPQISNKCLDQVASFYPQRYFYSSKSQIDKKYGRTICSTFIGKPVVQNKIIEHIKSQWLKNRSLTESFLDAHFEELVSECKDDYPNEKGLLSSKNERMRKICIEESYDLALYEAMAEWREEENHEYFADKEQSLLDHLSQLKEQKIIKVTK